MNAVYPQLALLEASGLVALEAVEPELSYSFRHPMMQEIAYNSLTRADRRRLHAAIAATLEGIYPERLEELAPVLGDHYDKAGDEENALHYYRVAARSAQRGYANPEAIRYYQRALDIVLQRGDRAAPPATLLAELCQNLGRVLELAGQQAEALRHYQRMETYARDKGNTALELTALLNRITLLSTPTDALNPDLARSLSDRALKLAHDLSDPSAEAKIYWNLLLASYFSSDLAAARAYGERSLELARRFDLREQQAYTLNDLGSYVYPTLGRLAESIPMVEEARSLFQEQGNLPMLADNAANLATIYYSLGAFDQALQMAEESYRLAKSIGNLWGQSYSRGVIGMTYAHQGLADLAIRNLDEAIHKGRGSGFAAALVICSCIKAYLYINFGLLDEALELAEEAVRAAGQVANYWVNQANGCLACVYILQGRMDEAQEVLQKSQTQDQALEAFFLTSMITTAECELRLARQDYAGLLTLTQSYLSLTREYRAEAMLADGLYYHGLAQAGLGRWDAARQALLEADQAAQKFGILRVRWKALGALAEMELTHGDRQAGLEWLRQAREVIARLLVHAGSERLKSAFQAQPHVRRLETLER